ncbi:hypothetical protein Tco_1221381 [Tanacetum coccineum]
MSLNQCHYIDKIINKFQHLNIEEANTSYESSCKLVENNGRVVAQIEYVSAIGCLMYATHCTRPDIVLDLILNIEEANTPYESSCKLVENNGRAVAQIEYVSAIGCLMYATHCTIPDIACKLLRYTSNPIHDHWNAIGRVIGYLKRTRQLALYYDRFPTVLEGYSYASWITGSSDSKSTTGWIFTLGGWAVS